MNRFRTVAAALALAALGLAPLTAPFILSCWLVHASVRILSPAQQQCRLRIER